MGLSFSEKLKKITLDELKQKLSKSQEIVRRYINYQIDEVNKYSPKELLISFFGWIFQSHFIIFFICSYKTCDFFYCIIHIFIR